MIAGDERGCIGAVAVGQPFNNDSHAVHLTVQVGLINPKISWGEWGLVECVGGVAGGLVPIDGATLEGVHASGGGGLLAGGG